MNDRGALSRSGWSVILDSKLLNWSLRALLFVTAVCAFVPFSPNMPWGSADASWQLGLSQAVAQGMAFGRDIVFTYGPLAAVYTKFYHPATDQLMLAGALYLGLLYGLVLLLVAKDSKWYLLIGFWVVLAGLMYARSAMYFSYPLLVGVFCFTLIGAHQGIRLDEKKAAILILVLFSPFGMLPLMKGSFTMLCAAVAALAFLVFLASKKWAWAFSVAVSTLLSLVFFWMLSGQSLADLPAYFMSMASLVSGYSDAMSKESSGREIACYILVSSVLLVVLVREKRATRLQRVFLFAVFFVYLFMAFKGGFVRYGYSAVAAATSLLIASLIVSMLFHTRMALVTLLLSVFVWIYIDSHAKNSSVESVARAIGSTYVSAWEGIGERRNGNAALQTRFNKKLQQLNKRFAFPLFAGTTDIYSYNQAYLIASGNHWNPRPVFQSYVAYSPELAEKNNNHLLTHTAPDNIIFAVEPIDRRMPSTEDGHSWFSILARYKPSTMANDFLYLHKNSEIHHQPDMRPLISAASYAFEEEVPVPVGQSLIVAKIVIKKTMLGRLTDFLFTTGALSITLTLESGASRTYRIVPGMAQRGFLVSPLVENTVQFGRLFGDSKALSDKQVRSFSIAPVGDRRLWESRFEVVFENAAPPAPMDISTLYTFDGEPAGLAGYTISAAAKCDGSIESVNGTSPAPQHFSATNILQLEGWLAGSAREALLPDSVLVVLRDENGLNTFIETRQKPHPWAAKYFKNPELARSGYTSLANVSRLSGNYSLGLALVEGDHIKICPQINIPATLLGMPF